MDIKKEMDMDLICGLMVVAANKNELSANMSLGELLDWLDAKILHSNLLDIIVNLQDDTNINIPNIANIFVGEDPSDLD